MTSYLQKALPWQSLKLPFNLQTREKIILAVGGVALVVFLLLQVIVFPLLDRRTRLQALMRSQTQALDEILILKSEYEALTQDNKRSEHLLKQRKPGFALYPFLESLAGRSGITQIGSMKPSTSNLKNSPYTLSMVEMRMDGITMEQLVAFLHSVETSKQMVWIKGITITRDEKKEALNTLLQVETLQR